MTAKEKVTLIKQVGKLCPLVFIVENTEKSCAGLLFTSSFRYDYK
jgi:hypothetical protein